MQNGSKLKGDKIMATVIDQEVKAIRTLFTALEPLQVKAREIVLDYVARRLDIKTLAQGKGKTLTAKRLPGEPENISKWKPGQVHIKALKQQKEPQSAIEMSALIAYYLAHKAPPNECKKTITTKDLKTYFKIAGFKLPTKPQFTLHNAKVAGYLNAIGNGKYKLNPAGYNLVVRNMPKTKMQAGGKISR
jgi:hypothetical protein